VLEAVLVNVVIVGFVAFSSWWSWHSSRPETLKRQLRAKKRLAISEAADGELVKIVGKVTARGELLRSPLTDRECVAYEVHVVETFTDSEIADREVGRTAKTVPFLVEDETGVSLVEPSNDIALEYDRTQYSDKTDTPYAAHKALLTAYKKSFAGEYSYFESVLEPGERVAVSGVAARDPDPGAPATGVYRGAIGTRLRICSSPRVNVTLSEVKDTFD
jgi:hypothetical protein